MNTLSHGVQDAFAMVVDDLMEGGYVPVFLQDHLMVQEQDQEKIFDAVSALKDLCVQNPWDDRAGRAYPIAITGGETAILNTLNGFEMGITATGYVQKGKEIGKCVKHGDVILGLQSSGIHSNGLSFCRRELFDKRGFKLEDKFRCGTTVGEELTMPTRIYMKALKELIKNLGNYIHGMVHITGGGYSKLRELISPERNVDIEISRTHLLIPHEIFFYAHELGTPSEDMYRMFNNGVGYMIAVDESHEAPALDLLRKFFPTERIGRVTEGTGRVVVESQYESSSVAYQS